MKRLVKIHLLIILVFMFVFISKVVLAGEINVLVDKLIENLSALIRAIRASKPPTSKGKFIRKITVSSTMGVGITLNTEEVV